MLQSIREHAQGWIAGVIVGLVCITFALWGVSSYFNNPGNVVVAKVDGEDITQQRFQIAFQQYRKQLKSVFGDKIDLNKLDQAKLKREAMKQLIDNRLLQHAASAHGMRIGDLQVASAIQSFQAFQRDGAFANDLYERRIRDLGLSPGIFEMQMHDDMLNEELRQGVAESAFVTRHEADGLVRLREQQRDFGYGIVPVARYTDKVKLSDSDIEGWYQAHSDRYMTTEEVKISYVELSLDELAKGIRVTEDKLREYYQAHQQAYQVKEQRRAHQILIQVAADASKEAQEKAKARAEEVYQKARAGEDFAALAKKYSDDIGSAKKGGDTGFFTRGAMIPGFDDKVFSMRKGEISEPVRTSFGYHIIRLDEIRPATTEPFEKVRDKLELTYAKSQAEEIFYAKADELSTLAFENPDDLDKVARALDLEVQHSDFFSRKGGEGIAADPRIIEAAFADEALNQRINTEPVELDNNRLVVLHVDDYKPARLLPLAEVRDQVVKALTRQRARDMATEHGHALIKRLQAGEDRGQVIGGDGLEWHEVQAVARDSDAAPHAIIRAAFKAGRPDKGAIYDGIPMGTGDFAIIMVSKVSEPGADAIKGIDRIQAKKDIRGVRVATVWLDLISTLRQKADIEVFEDRL